MLVPLLIQKVSFGFKIADLRQGYFHLPGITDTLHQDITPGGTRQRKRAKMSGDDLLA